jgi:hypothetical protein
MNADRQRVQVTKITKGESHPMKIGKPHASSPEEQVRSKRASVSTMDMKRDRGPRTQEKCDGHNPHDVKTPSDWPDAKPI